MKDLGQYLATRVMKFSEHESTTWLPRWNPTENLAQAWQLIELLKVGDERIHEYPLYTSVGCDGDMYYRATVSHQYDFMTVASEVDKESPARAICKAIAKAIKALDGDEKWYEHNVPKIYRETLTLDDAIEHAQKKAAECPHGKCAENHRELAAWLQELKDRKRQTV